MFCRLKNRFNNPISIISFLALAITVFACNNTSQNESLKFGVISTDKTVLGKYINIEKYNPEQVKWVCFEIDCESNPKKLSNCFKLEAELYFKKETITRLMDDYSMLSVTYRFLEEGDLGYKWLGKESKKKLEIQVADFKEMNAAFNNNYEIQCYSAYFFQKGNSKEGEFILLDENTLLISLITSK